MLIQRLLKINTFYKKYLHKSTDIWYNIIKPIYPPPGYNLEIPNWTPAEFLEKIGLGCE